MFICKGSNKQQRKGRIISNFTKGETFHLWWQPSALEGNLTMCPSFLHPPKKAFFSPSVWPRREYAWTLNWKENLLICFEHWQGVPYFYRQRKNRMTKTFIIVNITLCFSTPKRPFFSLQFGLEQNILGHKFQRRAYQFVLKATKVFLIPTQAE